MSNYYSSRLANHLQARRRELDLAYMDMAGKLYSEMGCPKSTAYNYVRGFCFGYPFATGSSSPNRVRLKGRPLSVLLYAVGTEESDPLIEEMHRFFQGEGFVFPPENSAKIKKLEARQPSRKDIFGFQGEGI